MDGLEIGRVLVFGNDSDMYDWAHAPVGTQMKTDDGRVFEVASYGYHQVDGPKVTATPASLTITRVGKREPRVST